MLTCSLEKMKVNTGRTDCSCFQKSRTGTSLIVQWLRVCSSSAGGVSLIPGLELTEKAMASHSRTLAWKIPWREEQVRLQSMGTLWVGHDWATSLSLFTFMHWRRKWQPTLVFLPGESQGRGSLVGCRLWGCTESDKTEVIWRRQQQLETKTLHAAWCGLKKKKKDRKMGSTEWGTNLLHHEPLWVLFDLRNIRVLFW